MGVAYDFRRDDCQVGGRRVTYWTLQRDWCCWEWGGSVVMQWDEAERGNWRVECGMCKGRRFITRYKRDRMRADAREVLALLPAEIADKLRRGARCGQCTG